MYITSNEVIKVSGQEFLRLLLYLPYMPTNDNWFNWDLAPSFFRCL